MHRSILHSDLNSFYASVEILLDPRLCGLPVAVGGSRETRHGIVLAKSELAKRAGVKTGMVLWEAHRCCPDLIVVPPQYEQYIRFSKLVRSIYSEYTDRVEPYGMDECWLDVTDVPAGTGIEVAEILRERIKSEIGLTVSIGVSFCKVFAKLGSDMRKPDAITVIPHERYRDIVWPRPAGEMLGVGPATERKLAHWDIRTIGQLAQTDRRHLKTWFGINGERLWRYANGMDESPVAEIDHVEAAKSYGHGVTTSSDLQNIQDVANLLYALAPRVSRKLREAHMEARCIEIDFRDNSLQHYSYRVTLTHPTRTTKELVEQALALFRKRYDWHRPVMSFTIRAMSLVSEDRSRQLDLFGDEQKRQKQERLEQAVDEIRARYGSDAIQLASATQGKLRKNEALEHIRMPGCMHGM